MVEYKNVAELTKQIADCKKSVINSSNSAYLTGYLCALSATEGVIASIPTADVDEVKHGKWRLETDEEMPNPMFKLVVCSVCNSTANGTYNYCPNCGAKMDKRSDTNART